MNLLELLEKDADGIVEEATDTLDRTRLAHYQVAGHEVSTERLGRLYSLTAECIRSRDLAPIVDYMHAIADERFRAGYDIREVQIAINVLEETIWQHVVANVPPGELAEALGLVSTVLGTAKDALARAYVSLASKSRVPSLDLSALFKGAAGG